ncbi:MAG: VWA domain-containing protein [Rhodobacterales bacterium]|nr:VWA domain-containing protein [Rhodobacterales bacterium]
MFLDLLFNLRQAGLVVGTGEWLGFLEALESGLIYDVDTLYRLGRALLCRGESEYDAYDQAFADTFSDAVLPDDLRKAVEEWLAKAKERPEGDWVDHEFKDRDELWEALMERLRTQKKEHHGGNHWIGTGGTSPFGHSGKGSQGIRIGGPGGGRQAVNVAMERQWANYRTDRTLDVRDLQVVLRTLRNLSRDGAWELDLDATIDRTCQNAGDIELVERRERQNRVHLVLLMDAGGSMAPHYDKVSKLFSAASKVHGFKSFESWSFHNCVYGWLYEDYEQMERVRTEKVLEKLTSRHRLIFVGDASMAPYELFSPFGWPSHEALAGLEWLRRFRQRCPGSVWLNPDPTRYWAHPTVRAIGQVFPMHELTVDGLRSAVKRLRAPV